MVLFCLDLPKFWDFQTPYNWWYYINEIITLLIHTYFQNWKISNHNYYAIIVIQLHYYIKCSIQPDNYHHFKMNSGQNNRISNSVINNIPIGGKLLCYFVIIIKVVGAYHIKISYYLLSFLFFITLTQLMILMEFF